MKKHKIILCSKSKKKIIKAQELLIPLNTFVSLVDYLDNFDKQVGEFISKDKKNNTKSLYYKTSVARRITKGNSIKITKISHNSPFLVEFITAIDPILLGILRALLIDIVFTTPMVEKKIKHILEELPKYKKLNEDQKNIVVKDIIKVIKAITKVITVDFKP